MARPRRVAVMLVRSDGTRIVRLAVPRWAVAVTLAAIGLGAALVATSVSAFYSDYLALRQQRDTMSVLLPRVSEERSLLESYRARARDLYAEIASWRDIHARILKPFGPDAGQSVRGAGIGGATAVPPTVVEPDRTSVREDLVRLTALVKEEGDNLRALEEFLSRAARVLASLPSRWPVRGPLNSDFGPRLSPWAEASEHHGGIDIGAPIGTEVKAPAPGVVAFAGRHPEYGIAIVIDHGSETRSIYGHLSKLHVTAEQAVQRGDSIGLTGNTGRSSGPHLHYEIQVRGQAVNPHTYLWEEIGGGAENPLSSLRARDQVASR
jgi:murein DD-endopeptidase MepM/ murein hydrolase activator NlpD